jgi:DNA-binding NarL/FixJ family response regulator
MKKILIVEDNDDMRMLYRRLFRKYKEISISECDNAEDAIRIISAEHPDLALIDISLPGKSGLELTKEISDNFKFIKILVVTAHERDRYYDDAINAGALDLVSKDIGIELVNKCMRILG